MAELANLNLIKRDKMRKEAAKRRVKEMRENLPLLTKKEIRRFRIPLYQALIEELKEDSYTSSAHFISQLIEYQNEQIKIHGPDSKVGLRPKLIEHDEILEQLYDTFKKAEDAHFITNDKLKEYDILQEIAVQYSYGSDDWWWLGEQIFKQCIKIIFQYRNDGGKRNAVCQYLYGRFLLTHNEEVDQSTPYLDTARSLSQNQFWSAKNILSKTTYDVSSEQTIFIESCKLLYQALMKLARKMKKTDILNAIELCSLARRRANEACYFEGEALAYMQQGYYEFECKNYEDAINSFLNSLRKNIKCHSPKGICEIRILLYKSFIKVKKFDKAFQCLTTLLEFAKEQNLPYYEGMAYRYIGEYYLVQGFSSIASPNLMKALNIFLEVDAVSQVEQVRNFAAISTGQELLTKFIDLVIKVGNEKRIKPKYLYKIMNWKDFREPFFTQEHTSDVVTDFLETVGTMEGLETEEDYYMELEEDEIDDVEDMETD